MLSSVFKHRILFFSVLALIVVGESLTSAQTTDFTYQGNLVDNAIPANGNYDFEFRLFAVSTDGTPIGTRTRLNVPVTNGGFTVRLDFLPAEFNGAERFLEIAVKPAGSPNPFTMLSPRQQLTYAPYSFHSLNAETADTATTATTATNATQLGGVAANQYVLTGDSRLSDARNPLPGSVSYIQSRTTQQPGIINFNISGDGTLGGTLSANTVIATAQYNIGNNRVLSVEGTENLFAGLNAGLSNTGIRNSFFGRGAGFENTAGGENSFFGFRAGNTNDIGNNNTAIGANADVGSGNLTNATAIGANAQVSTSNTMVLGTSSINVLVPGSLSVGSSSTMLKRIITVTATLNFPLVAEGSFSNFVVLVPGAELTDVVMIGVPPEAQDVRLIYTGHVTANGTVVLRVNCVSNDADPPAATFRIVVIGF